MTQSALRHVVVIDDPAQWNAVPANNGGNGPTWQWGNELLVGFTQGAAKTDSSFHQVDDAQPYRSMLARSLDGGESWQSYAPENYPGNCQIDHARDSDREIDAAVPLPKALDFRAAGFVLRVAGYGYHGNAGQQWFHSLDKGQNWRGPFLFTGLLDHPELAGRQFTSRTAYLVNAAQDCFLFLSVRQLGIAAHVVSPTDKVFLARTVDGGRSFQFVAWVVPPSDESRAVMPAPVRLSAADIVVALRRRNDPADRCWIDCYQSQDNGQTWAFLSEVGFTGGRNSNGNPPAMIRLVDGRLCCVYGERRRGLIIARFSQDGGRTWGAKMILRQDFHSANGAMDLGYPRLFQRLDGRLATVYFWCSPERPETHLEATLFAAP